MNEYIKNEIKSIENEIKNILKPNEYVVYDGLIDEKYFNEKIKISWMLKEGYSGEEQNLYYNEFFKDDDLYNDFFKNVAVQTWHPIIYITYSILNGFKTWQELPYIKDQPDMCEIVKQIIIINASKSFSKTGTFTTFQNLELGFERFKNINLKQIELYKPNVLIFGSTFYLYQEILGLDEKYKVQSYSNEEPINVYIKDKTMYIDAYHPGSRMTREKYINPIIKAVKTFKMEL
jgi:hypothetical protein